MQDGFETHVVGGQVFEGQVDASAFGVFRNIAQDVGELEGYAGFFGEFLGGGIAVAEDANADQSDDRRDEIAVAVEVGEGGVGVGRIAGVCFQIGCRAGNQFVEEAERNVEALRGVADGNKYWIAGRCAFAQRRAMRPAIARDCGGVARAGCFRRRRGRRPCA